MESAVAALNQAVLTLPRLTAIFITDGQESFRGTAYDAEVNAILRNRYRAVRQVRQPFLVTLEARRGKIVGWTANAADEPIRFPALPPPVPWAAEPLPAGSREPANRARAETDRAQPRSARPAEVALSPPASSSVKPSAPAQLTPAGEPAATPVAATSPSRVGLTEHPPETKRIGPPAAIGPPAGPVAPTEPTSRPPLETAQAGAEPPAKPSDEAPGALSGARPVPLAGAGVQEHPAGVVAPLVEPLPTKAGDERPSGVAPAPARAAAQGPGARPVAAAQQTATILPSDGGWGPWRNLAIGLALLVLAGGLIHLLRLTHRSRYRPSLISQSMERRPEPPPQP